MRPAGSLDCEGLGSGNGRENAAVVAAATWLPKSSSLRDVSAWFVSFLVHAGIFVGLASLTLVVPLREQLAAGDRAVRSISR